MTKISREIRPVGNLAESNIKLNTEFLNGLLANEYPLFTKTLNYHWNVTGPRFHSIHNFLEDQYNTLLAQMDDIAERVRVLGETPLGTVNEMNSKMDLDEKNGKELSSSQMLEDLYLSHMKIHEETRGFLKEMDSADDPGTEDFLVGVLKSHQMMSWMLKSHLD